MILEHELDEFVNRSNQLLNSLQPETKKERLAELEKNLNQEGSWEDFNKMTKIQKEIGLLQRDLKIQKEFETIISDIKVAFELGDEEIFEELWGNAHSKFEDLQRQRYLQGVFDTHNVLLSIHSGAGGIDAQDFASMLMNMYQAFSKNQGWNCSIVSISLGEEGGIKSAMAEISGEYVYGLLKEEVGVHRLVRISPFNSGKTRETSFALVEVIPTDLESIMPSQVIEEKDIRWDYFMASGKGGQSVNTTYSAVRLTHIPTGISVSCQNERSQQQNKQQALKYLQDKLAILEIKKMKELTNEIKGEFQAIEWGNHIRSYVLHPYKMVKDHRNGWQMGNPDLILEGKELLDLIWSLKTEKKGEVLSTNEV